MEIYDLFISHAAEDRKKVAKPLSTELKRRGYRVWLDDSNMKIGDSLHREVDSGLAGCRFGVVVLSRNFFKKRWPAQEIAGLFSREIELGEKVILPVWHRVTRAEVLEYSPTLADRFAPSTDEGIAAVADKIAQVLGAPVQSPAGSEGPQKGGRNGGRGARFNFGVKQSILIGLTVVVFAVLIWRFVSPGTWPPTGNLGLPPDTRLHVGDKLFQLGSASKDTPPSRPEISEVRWDATKADLYGTGFGAESGRITVQKIVYASNYRDEEIPRESILRWTDSWIQFSWPRSIEAPTLDPPRGRVHGVGAKFTVTTGNGYSTNRIYPPR